MWCSPLTSSEMPGRITFGNTRPLPPLLLTRSTSTPSTPLAADLFLTGMHL